MKRGEIYPSWRYHKTGAEAPKLVTGQAEDDALGPDWDVPEAWSNNTPIDFDEDADEPKKKATKKK